MLSVAVHKDIGEYTEKVVGKLSARTLACTAGGLASSVATAAALNLALGVPVDAATLPVMAASSPEVTRPPSAFSSSIARIDAAPSSRSVERTIASTDSLGRVFNGVPFIGRPFLGARHRGKEASGA